ncbi:MAG: hypothetical protein HQM04_13840 [Magnetococcales bacterium]|nr:hypothetical protein [Magnetococcales bacterium]MBF0116105.1 hypothetical protein [Magnetococcales bacterium]
MATDSAPPAEGFLPHHHAMVQKAVGDFKEAMKIRSGLNLRVAVRVTTILRTGMISLAVVAIVFLLLLALVSSKLEFMIGVMDTMNSQFSSMAKDMAVMRQVIEQMDAHMASLPVIVNEVGQMHGSVAALNTDIQVIAKKMHQIEQNLGGITTSVDAMNTTFQGMDMTVRGIDYNVHRMARPMKLFNNIVPLP